MSIINRLLCAVKKQRLAINVFDGVFEKRCLILYLATPFLDNNVKEIHQNIGQVKVLAERVSKRGYIVDVGDYNIRSIKGPYMYDLIIDLHPQDHPVFEKRMNPGCIRIAYITGSNPVFSNEMERRRVTNCNDRRGTSIVPRRQVKRISKKMEEYDSVFLIGNEFTRKSFADFNIKKWFLIPNTGYNISALKHNKKNFLFIGSAGQIHKGLDLLLEVFSKEGFPFDIYICSSFQKEKDFEKEYRKELYSTRNIHAMGFVDIPSDEMMEIASQCSFVILPSCSEGQAGSICAGMSYGLVPICTRECGFEEDEVILIEDVSIQGIEKTIMQCGNMDEVSIAQFRKKTLTLIKNKYNLEKYAEIIDISLERTINEKGSSV